MVRYDSLFELLAQAKENGWVAEVTLHNVPLDVAAGWLQSGLLDEIERGAVGNPPTGRVVNENREVGEPRTSAVVFTNGPRRQA